MVIKQISVFLENKSGRLHEMAKALGDAEINIRSVSLADSSDFGIVRLIVNRPEDASRVLKEAGFTVGITHVIAVEVPDAPGGLAIVMKMMDEASINIEYMYAFVEKTKDSAILIIRFDEIEKAVDALMGRGLRILHEKDVLSL